MKRVLGNILYDLDRKVKGYWTTFHMSDLDPQGQKIYFLGNSSPKLMDAAISSFAGA